MPEATWTILATGLGGLIAWLSTRQQLTHGSRLEAQKRFVEKMERLHEVLTEIDQQAGTLQMMVLTRISMGMAPDAKHLSKPIDTGTLQMLVNYYVPNLKPEVDSIQTAMTKLAEVIGRCILEAELDSDKKEKYAVSAVDAYVSTVTAVRSAKAKLEALVTPHAMVPQESSLGFMRWRQRAIAMFRRADQREP